MSGRRPTGEGLWLSLYQAEAYQEQAAKIDVSAPQRKPMTPELATRRWLEGMARQLRERFPEKLRLAREKLRLTQQDLAQIAELSVTGLAMIERGERLPTLDTAARICWALDVASGSAVRESS